MDKEYKIPRWMITTMAAGVTIFLVGLILDDICVVVTGLYLNIISTICLAGGKISHDTERFINDAAKHTYNRGE